MRAVAVMAVALLGCAELGVITDGTSVSYGKPSNGFLIDGVRIPDKGEGFTTRELWRKRGVRYGTDELVAMLTGVAQRLHQQIRDVRMVIADLSEFGGGAAHAFHRSHQSGRDVDLLYFMRDAEGNSFEADAMRVFDRRGRARDRSGITIDVPRTWQLVRELLEAPEATVQFVFMYEPIAEMLIDHAKQIGEPDAVVLRARRALKQPGDSARHDDHIHVRVYCASEDRQFGCLDLGPVDLLALRDGERRKTMQAVATALPRTEPLTTAERAARGVAPAATLWADNHPIMTQASPRGGEPAEQAADTPTSDGVDTVSFSSLLQVGARDLRGWR